MRDSTKILGAALALGRIAIGAGLWLAPERTARRLGLRHLDAKATMLGRIAATRDVVLGAWQLSALDDPVALRRVSAAVAICDAGDTLTFALSAVDGEERTAGLLGAAIALPAALANGWLSQFKS